MPWKTVTRPFENIAKKFNTHGRLEETIQIVERSISHCGASTVPMLQTEEISD
jgi:hypothetical protein